MVIIKLIGGLGNQMFQYAASSALAHRLGAELKLDTSSYDKSLLREYELDVFHINASLASIDEIVKLKYAKETLVERLARKIQKRPPPFSDAVYTEPHFHYDQSFENLQNDTYLTGYFQSEKYFSLIQDLIRQELCFRSSLKKENKSMAEQISSSTSVSVHFRRGDYVNDLQTNSVHGICGLDYYQTAMQFISSKIAKPIFFCFSDDIDWAKEHITSDHPLIFVANNGPDSAFEDMRLMSMCKHNIIANSSFSWWGAWLNANSDKTVIAPRKWFKKEEYNTKDLIPNEWVRL